MGIHHVPWGIAVLTPPPLWWAYIMYHGAYLCYNSKHTSMPQFQVTIMTHVYTGPCMCIQDHVCVYSNSKYHNFYNHKSLRIIHYCNLFLIILTHHPKLTRTNTQKPTVQQHVTWQGPHPSNTRHMTRSSPIQHVTWQGPHPSNTCQHDRVPTHPTHVTWQGPHPSNMSHDRVPIHLTHVTWQGPHPSNTRHMTGSPSIQHTSHDKVPTHPTRHMTGSPPIYQHLTLHTHLLQSTNYTPIDALKGISHHTSASSMCSHCFGLCSLPRYAMRSNAVMRVWRREETNTRVGFSGEYMVMEEYTGLFMVAMRGQ